MSNSKSVLYSFIVSNQANEKENITYLDKLIDGHRGDFFSNFVKKWINHKHVIPYDECKRTASFDGDWKVGRIKCCYDQIHYESPEYGAIQIGCTKTPLRGSYFCRDHKDHQLKFKVGDDYINLHPKNIKLTKKCKKF